jgi:hypothetical protein
LSEINAAGTVTFSTCLGQGASDVVGAGISDMVLGPSANVYVIGSGAVNLPLVNPIQSQLGSGFADGVFVAEIDPRTPTLLFSSLINVPALDIADYPTGVGVDSNGDIFASGFSTNFEGGPGVAPILPVFNGLQNIPAVSNSPCIRCAVSDGFVMKIAPTDAPAAALIPDLLEFDTQATGTSSASQPVTIIDMGSTALSVSNATVTGDFSIQNNCATVGRRDLHHCGDLHPDGARNTKWSSNHYGQLSWQPSHRATRRYGRGSHGGADPVQPVVSGSGGGNNQPCAANYTYRFGPV